jgi:NAD(P)-dependent dehydrogenase (short-subunit alcohol dehydrogenase family)
LFPSRSAGLIALVQGAVERKHMARNKAAIVTRAQQGIGATLLDSLAIEYAKRGIRFNAAPSGVVDTPLHKVNPKEDLQKLQPMGSFAEIRDIKNAVLHLSSARQVTGGVLHVDGGAHIGRW